MHGEWHNQPDYTLMTYIPCSAYAMVTADSIIRIMYLYVASFLH